MELPLLFWFYETFAIVEQQVFMKNDTIVNSIGMIRYFQPQLLYTKKFTFSNTDLTKLSLMLFNLLTRSVQLYGNSNVYIVTNGGKSCVLDSLYLINNYCKQNQIKNSFSKF